MTRKTVSIEAALVVRDESSDAIDRGALVRMTAAVPIEHLQEVCAIHPAKLAARSAQHQNESPKPAEKLNPSFENPKSARKSAARSIVARALTP